jgi:NADP-dependent 3-hydroxy acid dehydrogenase YdfG
VAVPHRTAVVTGASAGVGRAIALALSRRGYRVALLARSAAGLHSARAEIQASGGEAATYEVDVADADAVFRAADAIAQDWGAIDLWVNNAMATIYAPIAAIAPEEFKRVTEVTYLGTVYGTMAALKHMRQRGSGTIVQIGSALSYRAIPLQSAYCGGKFAERAFTDALRSELKHDGSRIRLTMVQLPAVNTPQFDWARNRMGKRAQPVPPIFQPEAIAEHVVGVVDAPPRELWIGWPTVKVIFGNIAAPGYLDRFLARHAYRDQMSDEPRPPGETDNLFDSPASGHRTHGRFDERAKARVPAFRPAHLRAAVLVTAVLGLAAAATLGYALG